VVRLAQVPRMNQRLSTVHGAKLGLDVPNNPEAVL